jgi:hypothetical protein
MPLRRTSATRATSGGGLENLIARRVDLGGHGRNNRWNCGGLKLFSASKCDPARLRSNVSWWRPDCLAGHVGLEVRRETGKE